MAITTATYGSTSAATIRIGHNQWMPASDATIAPTKQTVRMPIEMTVAALARRDVGVPALGGRGDADRGLLAAPLPGHAATVRRCDRTP